MAADIGSERLSELIGMIYDCALDPSRWTTTISAIHEDLGFCNASLAVHSLPSGATAFNIAAGIDERWLRLVPDYESDLVDLWGGYDRAQGYPLYEPIVNSQVVAQSELERNRYFVEWCRPQGITDAVIIGFARDASMAGTLAMGRHSSAGPVGDEELTTLRILAPHFRRAVSISRLLDLQAIRLANFRTMLDGVAAAILLVDAQMRLVFANQAALASDAAHGMLALRNGTLRLTDKAAQTQLQAAIVQAAQDESALHRRGIGIPARSSDGTPAVIHLLPLRGGDLRRGLIPQAVAAVFLAPAQATVALPMDALAALYDLTPAETRVAELVARGVTQKDISTAIGVAPSTVKSHLLQVFVKTGSGRQVELVNLVRSFLGPA